MIKVLLVGNPNTGKTTLYNKLTGKKEKTGNWNGVTSTVVNATFKYKGKEIKVYDLPGVYSLDGGTLEEKIASDFIRNNDFDLIVNLIEARQLKRSLALTKQLSFITNKLLVAINMEDEAEISGYVLDIKKLELSVGIKCVFLNVYSRENLKNFKDVIINKISNKIVNFETNYVYENCVKSTKSRDKKINLKMINNKFFSLACIALTVCCIYLSFGNYGLGTLIKNGTEKLFSSVFLPRLVNLMETKNCSDFSIEFVSEVFNSLLSVLAFFPQLAVLYACITVLEESGLLSRLSFSLNGFLNVFGFNGRSVFPLFGGFCCTAAACGFTSAAENFSLKKKTAFVLPMIPCSARIPVFLYLIAFLTKKYCAAVMICVYIVAVTLMLIFARVYTAFNPLTVKDDLLIELPPIRKAGLNKIIKSLINSFKQFIIKIGFTVFIVSVTLFILSRFNLRLRVADDVRQSILYKIGETFSFLFYPIGLNEPKLTVAVLSGLFAKEGVVSTLVALYPAGICFSKRQIIALIAFFAFYTPCFVALGCMRKQIGLKNAIKSGVFQFIFALLLCYAVYALAKSVLMWSVGLLIAIAVILAIIKLRKSKPKGCLNEKIYCKKTE